MDQIEHCELIKRKAHNVNVVMSSNKYEQLIKVELPGVEPGSGEGIDSAFFMFITRCCRGVKGRVKTSLHPYAAINLQLSSYRLQISGHFDRL